MHTSWVYAHTKYEHSSHSFIEIHRLKQCENVTRKIHTVQRKQFDQNHNRCVWLSCRLTMRVFSFFLLSLSLDLSLRFRSIDQNLCKKFLNVFASCSPTLKFFRHKCYKWNRLISHAAYGTVCKVSVLVCASYKWSAANSYLHFFGYYQCWSTYRFSDNKMISSSVPITKIATATARVPNSGSDYYSECLYSLYVLLYFVNKFVIWINMNWLVYSSMAGRRNSTANCQATDSIKKTFFYSKQQ